MPIDWTDISRHYDGPGLGPLVEWKCPQCSAVNTGPLDAGCATCGSGSARPQHIGTPPPGAAPPNATQAPDLRILTPSLTTVVSSEPSPSIFAQWWNLNEPTLLQLPPHEIARLAWDAATAVQANRTMIAPPVTADVAGLAPEGKPRRTIIAALEYFREHILPSAGDEIASGEWCSAEEITELVRQLKAEEGML